MTDNPVKTVCGAHARTTGAPCQRRPMKNGRCRLHGGASTGRPPIHGRYTKAAEAERRAARELVRHNRRVMQAIADRLDDKIDDAELLRVLES